MRCQVEFLDPRKPSKSWLVAFQDRTHRFYIKMPSNHNYASMGGDQLKFVGLWPAGQLTANPR